MLSMQLVCLEVETESYGLVSAVVDVFGGRYSERVSFRVVMDK